MHARLPAFFEPVIDMRRLTELAALRDVRAQVARAQVNMRRAEEVKGRLDEAMASVREALRELGENDT